MKTKVPSGTSVNDNTPKETFDSFNNEAVSEDQTDAEVLGSTEQDDMFFEQEDEISNTVQSAPVVQKPVTSQASQQRSLNNQAIEQKGQQAQRPQQSDNLQIKRVTSQLPQPQTTRQTQPSPQGQRQVQARQQNQVQANQQPQSSGTQVLPDNGQPLMIQENQQKKKSKLPLIVIGVVAVIIVGVVGFLATRNKSPQQNVTQYELTGRYALDNLLNGIINYNADTLNTLVKGSNLSQEWSYANHNELRQNWIISVCSYLKFQYPQVQALDTDGNLMVDESGQKLMQVSDMTNGESVTVTVVDYEKLSATIQEDKDAILKMYQNSGYSPKDYTYTDEMTDLMLDYLLSKSNLPTTTIEIEIPLKSAEVSVNNNDGSTSTVQQYVVVDDSLLDKTLFSSDSFHNMCDTFAKVATQWTGKTTETYTAQELVDNPKYAEWKKLLDKYMKEDNGKYKKGVSKWEPWYKRDKDNNYVIDKNGEKVVNYYTIKDKHGNDVMQPDKQVLGDVKKTREVEDPFIAEQVIPYTWVGAFYCQNERSDSPIVAKVGDGSFKYPAGVGTSVVTKVKDINEDYRDVRITMTGYWVGQDAINYAISFSEKNRGFDNTSVVKLICYEIKVENLEDEDFTIESEMFLSDAESNQSSRTGTMYGFLSKTEIKAGETVTINDWATSTEIEQKYACWGKSFGRQYKVVWFRLLAGSGTEVKDFNASSASTEESKTP